MKTNTNVKKIGLTAAIAALSLAGWALGHYCQKTTAKPASVFKHEASEPAITYDPKLLKEFSRMTHELDFSKRKCVFSGFVEVYDASDTSENVHHMPFLYCKDGKDFYYRMGSSETIRYHGLDLFISHDQKKVVLSDRDLHLESPTRSIAGLENRLQEEHYQLVARIAGNSKTLTALNEHHITCKELSVTYDTISGRPQRFFTRVSCVSDPLNKKLDRDIAISLNAQPGSGNLSDYTTFGDVVDKVKGQWKLTGRYSDYGLIIL